MSAQTPQKEACPHMTCEEVNALIFERDHYKALCEELREALEAAANAFGLQMLRDRGDKELLEGWHNLQRQARAALKKAHKDI
jgi:TRAP-type mannitol/chloroaromatic compound transport system substrate-binding protein